MQKTPKKPNDSSRHSMFVSEAPFSQAEIDAKWMRRALVLAEKAAARGEVPVGAILVKDNQVLSMASNQKEKWQTCLGHAELIAIQRASQKLGAWRLLGATLYVTLEPCVMCAGALVQARISRLVYGAADPKGGAVDSLFKIGQDSRLNHRIEVTAGVQSELCSSQLSGFFRKRRQNQKK